MHHFKGSGLTVLIGGRRVPREFRGHNTITNSANSEFCRIPGTQYLLCYDTLTELSVNVAFSCLIVHRFFPQPSGWSGIVFPRALTGSARLVGQEGDALDLMRFPYFALEKCTISRASPPVTYFPPPAALKTVPESVIPIRCHLMPSGPDDQ